MKKLSKLIYFIFAFALITCMAIFNPTINFVSADDSNESKTKTIEISNSKIVNTVEAGEDLVIPNPTVSDTSLKKYVVVSLQLFEEKVNEGEYYPAEVLLCVLQFPIARKTTILVEIWIWKDRSMKR